MITAAIRAANRQRESIGKTQRECPICASLHLEYEFLVDKSPVCGCQTCGLLFLNPSPGPLPSAQANPPTEPQTFPAFHEANAEARLNELLQYSSVETGKILLVGADSYLAARARQCGLDSISLSLEEFESHLDSALLPRVDLCVLYCSIERLQDPFSALQSIRAILSDAGALMIVSPTADTRPSHLSHSTAWEFSRHNRFYFSIDTLQSLAVKAGFGDPLITPDQTLVSINSLRQSRSQTSHGGTSRTLPQRISFFSPFWRDRPFHTCEGKTRFLLRPKPARAVPLLSVIVPVFNEKSTFVDMIEPLLQKSMDGIDIEVIIVESNSTDGTRDEVRRYADHPRVNLILEDKPRGKGHAVRTALQVAKGDIVLFQDADLEYDLNDYDALVSSILRYESNFVLGSRHNAGKNNWKIRKFDDSAGLASFFNFGHLLFLTLFNIFYRQRLTDPFTMYKVFRRDCLWGLLFECNRFDFDFEIVIKLLRKGYRPLELPVNYTSRSLNEGKKVTMFRDPLTWIHALLKFRKSPLYGAAQKR